MAEYHEKSNEQEFAVRYSRLVTQLVRRYFLRGGDFDDLFQEGMIALLNAIRKYDPLRNDNFEAFAYSCIKNRLVSVMQKSSVECIYKPEIDLIYNTVDIGEGPEVRVLAEESAREIKKDLIGSLSEFEMCVLDLYLEGFTVTEISSKLDRPEKSVNNAITRIRNKLKGFLKKRRHQG